MPWVDQNLGGHGGPRWIWVQGAGEPANPTAQPPAPVQWGSTTNPGIGSPPIPAGAGSAAQPPAPTTAAGPWGSSTIGYNGNQGLGGTQQPGIFGTGTYIANPYAINDAAITGIPSVDAGQNYGLNNVWGNIQGALGSLAPQNYATQGAQLGAAPQFNAASGYGASGTAAQASAAMGQAAQGSSSGYGAATGGPASYSAVGGGPSTYLAGTGGPSSTGQVSGQASLGNAALAGPAQARAALGGYALAGPTGISTAGDAGWQGQQQGLANVLHTQASGGGWSPADLQLRQGTDNQIASQLAVLGSQRGGYGNAALSARSAADQSAAAEQNLNSQMGIQRAQETIQAQQALGSVLGTGRGQAQNYNLNQAQLNQQTGLANAGYAQQSGLANLSNAQQAALYNASNLQGANQYNASNLQNMSQYNAGAQNTMIGQNMALAQNANQYNASNAQQALLANINAQNMAAQFNAGQGQQMTLADMNAQNQAAQFNAGNAQNMNLANLGAINQANQFTAGNAQNMTLANMLAQNNMTGQNLSAQNAMTSQNLTAQNQFGLNNVNNAQQMAMANLANQQQQNLANQSTASTYGLQQGSMNQQTAMANQQAALAGQSQYYNQYNALLGAGTGVAESNRAAALANQQLQTQQQIANNQVNAQAFASSANANGNLTGSLIGAGAALGSAAITAASDERGKTDIREEHRGVYGVLRALSDQNLKTGIEGGNPMLQSFLTQYREFKDKDPSVDPTVGQQFRLSTGPGTAGTKADKVGGTLKGAASGASLGSSILPGWGTAIGAVGGAIAGFFGAGDDKKGTAGPVRSSGVYGDAHLSDAPDYSKLAGADEPGSEGSTPATPQAIDPTLASSDDQAKENVISGNRGMQAFLQQQGSQTNAQNQQGSQNNAFMQTGQAPNPQVDRQMPDINAGYGQPQGIQGPGMGYGGFVAGGDVTQQGGFGGGGFGGIGGFLGGNYTPGSQQSQASFQNGAVNGQASYQPGSANGGSLYTGGMTQNAGITSAGGVGVSPTETQGGMSSQGGWNNAPQSTTPAVLREPAGQGASFRNQNAVNFGNYLGASNNISQQTLPDTSSTLPLTLPASSFTFPAAPPASTVGAVQAAQNPATTRAPAIPTVAPAPTSSTLAALHALQVARSTRLAAPAAAPAPTPWAPASGAQYAANYAAGNAEAQPSGLPQTSPYVLGSLFATSDEKEKEHVEQSPEEVKSMLDHLQAYSYRYKDPTAPGAAPGRRMGVMAQDLEKSPLGGSFVRDTPQGKMVDYGQAAGTMMAALAYHNERLDEHEQRQAHLESLLRRAAGTGNGA